VIREVSSDELYDNVNAVADSKINGDIVTLQQNHNIGKRSAEKSDSQDVSAATILTSGYLMGSCGVLALVVLSSLAAYIGYRKRSVRNMVVRCTPQLRS